MIYKIPVKVEPLCNLSNFDGATNDSCLIFKVNLTVHCSVAYFEKVEFNSSDKQYINSCLQKNTGLNISN